MKGILTFLWCILSVAMCIGQHVSVTEIKGQTMYIQAHQQMMLGDYDDALEKYKAVVDADVTNASAYHDMARIYLAKEQLDEAIKYATKAKRLSPQQLWYSHTLADIYRISEDYPAEAKELASIVEIRKNQLLYEKWIKALVNANKPQEALSAYQEMMLHYGMKDRWVDECIDIYLAVKDEKGAETLIKKYVADAPQDLEREVKLGEFFMYRQRYGDATKVFSRILSKDPTNEKALFNKRILDRAGQVNDDPLSAIINDPTRSMDDKIKELSPMIQALHDKPTSELANSLRKSVSELIEIAPDNAKLFALLGDIDYMTNAYPSAIQHYQRAITIDPSVYSIWSNLLVCIEQTQDYQLLAKQAESTMDYYPNLSEPYYYMAVAQWRLNDVESAKDYLEEATMISGSDVAMAERLAILSAQITYKDDKELAIKELIDFQTSTGKSARIAELLGDLHQQMSDAAKAEEYWREALTLGGDRSRLMSKIQSL